MHPGWLMVFKGFLPSLSRYSCWDFFCLVSGDGRVYTLSFSKSHWNTEYHGFSFFPRTHIQMCYWKKQYLRDDAVSFFANPGHHYTEQLPCMSSFIAWDPQLYQVDLPPTFSRRAPLYFTVHGTSNYFFMWKFGVAVQPLGITVSKLALQYWGDAAINPSDSAGAATVWWKGLCITT